MKETLAQMVLKATEGRLPVDGSQFFRVKQTWKQAWRMFYAAKEAGHSVHVENNGPDVKSMHIYSESFGQIEFKRGHFGGFVMEIGVYTVEFFKNEGK